MCYLLQCLGWMSLKVKVLKKQNVILLKSVFSYLAILGGTNTATVFDRSPWEALWQIYKNST